MPRKKLVESDFRKNWGTGSRALVIRSYRAVFDGQTHHSPTISMPVHRTQRDGRCDLDLLLVPPAGVTDFKPDDTVEMDLQWITLPRVADDYYGPNEAFRNHLAANPRSWKTVYREARGNDLDVTVDGGVASHTYPIIIQASRPEITVDIRHGVGADGKPLLIMPSTEITRATTWCGRLWLDAATAAPQPASIRAQKKRRCEPGWPSMSLRRSAPRTALSACSPSTTHATN